MQIPFLSFEETNRKIKAEIITAFEKVFDGSAYILGKEVIRFETAYAEYNKTNYCVGVSNGLDALFLALKTLGLNHGDEVIIPSHTFIATALAVTHAGLRPVLVEPDRNTCNLDPNRIEEAIIGRTRAIIPVHLYGQACRMDEIMSIAQKHNLFVVEDNAQSQGATYHNRPCGSWGEVNATSFYPAKNLGALGDAGAITTNNQTLAARGRLLRNYGSAKKYHHEAPGYNMRLDECQAAFLSVKLKYLDEWIKQRQEIASWYHKGLSEVEELTIPYVHPGASHVYHLYVIRTKQRDRLQHHLYQKGIGTMIHYPVAMHLQPAYAYLGYKKGSFPIAEEIAGNCLSLPLWPGMEQQHIEQVCTAIKEFFAKESTTVTINAYNKTR